MISLDSASERQPPVLAGIRLSQEKVTNNLFSEEQDNDKKCWPREQGSTIHLNTTHTQYVTLLVPNAVIRGEKASKNYF